MSIKPDFDTIQWELRYFMDQTASQGFVVCLKTAGSGVAQDSSLNEVEISAAPSGKSPVGVLFDDVVDLDTTRYHVNQHKREVQKGGKVSIVRKGWLVTDAVYPSAAATAGSYAVLANSGYVMNAPAGWNVTHANFPSVGKFKTNKDLDGFVTLQIDL